EKVGACFAIETVFEEAEDRLTIGGFQGEILERDLSRAGPSRLSVGAVRVCSRITTEEQDFDFAVLHLGDHNLLGGIRPAADRADHAALSRAFARADLTDTIHELERLYGGPAYSPPTLFPDQPAAIPERLLADPTRAAEEPAAAAHEPARPLMRFLQSLEQPAPPAFLAAAELTLMTELRRELGAGRDVDLERVKDLVEEAEAASVRLDPLILGLALQGTLEALLRALDATPD